MIVASIRLLFDDGEASAPVKPGKDDGAPETALRNMLAESRGRFAHRVQFRMADGAIVTARAKAQASHDIGCRS